MLNYEHVGKGTAVLRFYISLCIFVIRFPYSEDAFNNILCIGVVIFLDVSGSLPLRPLNIQVSDILAVQDALVLVHADKV